MNNHVAFTEDGGLWQKGLGINTSEESVFSVRQKPDPIHC